MERPRRRRRRTDPAADGGPRDGQPQNGQPGVGPSGVGPPGYGQYRPDQAADAGGYGAGGYEGASYGGTGYGDERYSDQGGPGGELIPADQARADELLPERVAELAAEISEAQTEPRRRRLTLALPRLAGRGGRGAWAGLRSGGRWLTTQVLAMAPRLPVRSVDTLRGQFPGRTPDELGDILIEAASKASASVGAAVGAAMVLPVVPAAPVEIGVETLALVGIELKLIAELHEVYGMRPRGSKVDRTMAYLDSWAHRRGVGLAPGGLVIAIGSPLRRRLERRLVSRAGRSALSLGPLLTGAAAGALLNRRETRKLGREIRDDLRRRSPAGTQWPY
ncbi:MAG: hypothetical protein ACRDPO_15605 [Streptosporangiaceae bacterium]